MAEAGAVVWVRGPGSVCKAVPCPPARWSVQDVIHRHCQHLGMPVECFFVKCNGALISTSDPVHHGAVYSLEPRLCGGKGGFGSMLRALGAQIEKTTNREACRDLSGRRLRDVNHEKAMAEWVKQQAERDAEKEQKRLERLQRKLTEPKHCFTSPEYQQQCHEMAERLEDSVLKGIQASSSKVVSAEVSENRKRPNRSQTEQGVSAKKRKCFWLGMEELETVEGSSSESSDDDSEEIPGTSRMSFSSPKSSRDHIEVAAECPSSAQRARELTTDSESSEKQQSPVTDPVKGISEDSCVELGQTSAEEHGQEKMVRGIEEMSRRKKAEYQEPIEKVAAGTALNKDKETEVIDGERAHRVVPGEDRGYIPLAEGEETSSGNMGLTEEGLDLLVFSSAAELELLGLEKLKYALAGLGLKCGGTLQERAARLFSVRGLVREQIDPVLFAKPSKGKKK
ncbi:PREDICTED: protein SDE2 homolog [Chinchilla lanigera]|uniref:Replication stress response regulator SDE2 n=1 Tax=Chinchilla lanigera TaxID=34839 RepID=A0A8C2USM7_CHILA|nr:PREDICTED: protein SDE2 homolog [Chinchilla lanigera]